MRERNEDKDGKDQKEDEEDGENKELLTVFSFGSDNKQKIIFSKELENVDDIKVISENMFGIVIYQGWEEVFLIFEECDDASSSERYKQINYSSGMSIPSPMGMLKSGIMIFNDGPTGKCSFRKINSSGKW